jgi:VWFA-related protein
MKRFLPIFLFILPAFAADGDPVFRSDVSLVRVDVQVLDGEKRAITGLHREDFVLRESGQVREIRNFASEEMPVDLLFLLDISGSMRPHVERIATASRDALRVLTDKDRVAIMVFDTMPRVRMPFRSSMSDVDREFQNLLRQESFNGGTEITGALLEAASYIRKNGRKEARRAIVILTDDETGGARDEAAVSRALTNAQAVLSALIAPDAMSSRMGYPPGTGRGGRGGSTWPGGGGSTWPGGGGGGGGPLGGIILGGPMGYPRTPGGGRYPGNGGGGGPLGGGSRTHPAGTAEIARQSGGDSLPVDGASALEDTINRIRRRYALHFHLDDAVKPGLERTVDVALSATAQRRYPDATVRFRRVYMTPGGTDDGNYTGMDERPVITRSPKQVGVPATRPSVAEADSSEPTPSPRSSDGKRRAAISEPDGPRGANPSIAVKAEPEEAKSSPASPAPSTPAPAPAPAPQQGGWRVLKPGEKP